MSTTLRDRVFSDDEPIMVSICAISFNHENYIEQCIEGFLDQTCDFRVEIIIHDDASTDRTAQIIRDYAERHPTLFRTILQTENQYSKGVNPYFAYVMPKAKGQYIAFCDGDDFWSDPNKLARQVAVMEADLSVALTYGAVVGVSETGEEVRYKGAPEQDYSADDLKAAPRINTLTACFRNIYKDQPTSLFIRTATIGDLTVWAMLGYHGSGRFLSELEPACYRLHSAGLMSMHSRERQLFMATLAHFHMAAFHHESGDAKASTASVREAIDHYNQMGFELLSTGSDAALPLKDRLKRWRRALKRRLLSR